MRQDIQVILVKKIKSSLSGKRSLSSTVLDQPNDSISKEGLINPIAVRPDPAKPGEYLIVAGEHRYYVVAKMMKQEAIECRVFADMTEEAAELTKLSENACRTLARPTDRLLQLRMWQEVYMKHFPQLVGKKASGASRWVNSTKAEAKQQAIDDERQQEAGEVSPESSRHSGDYSADAEAAEASPAEVESASEPTAAEKHHAEVVESGKKAARVQTYRERVQAVTGAPARTLDRDIKIVNNLDEEQCYVLEAVACPKMGMLKIIDATEDRGKRGEIVNLVASGMEVEQAIKEVVGVTTTKDQAGRAKEVGEVEAKPEPESDEEWFQRNCSEFAGHLSDPDLYKSDAILYHQIADARNQFRKSIKKIVEQYRNGRKGKKVGWFYLALCRVLNISYPNGWAICLNCGGRGMVDPGMECPKCKGSCYDLKTERY